MGVNENINAVNSMFDETLSYFQKWTAKGLPEGYDLETINLVNQNTEGANGI